MLLLALSVSLARAGEPGAFPYPITSQTLANGLSVSVIPMPSDGVAAVYVWMSVGSHDEPDVGRTGFAHFFEHLMFYGTPTLGGKAREDAIVRLGADENAWTWNDETVYHAVLASDRVDKYLGMQADLFQHLHLTDDDVRREAGAVYGEFRKGQSDPDNKLSETLYGTAFTQHPYSHDTIGYEADIAAMPTAHPYAEAFFSRMYRPENARIIVVGDVKPEAVFAEVANDWSSWERGTEVRPFIAPEPVQTARRTAAIAWPTSTAAQVSFGWKVPGNIPGEADNAALIALSDILLSDVGRLHRRLINDEGLAYDVMGYSNPYMDPGLFTVTITLKSPSDLAKVEAIVQEEVDRFKIGVDPTVLANAREHSRNSLLLRLDDPDAVASAIGPLIRRGGSTDAYDRADAAYLAVTPAAIAAVASKYLVDTGLTVVELTGPAEGTP